MLVDIEILPGIQMRVVLVGRIVSAAADRSEEVVTGDAGNGKQC